MNFRVTALLLSILLFGGCFQKIDQPTGLDPSIGFVAGQMLLRDDETRAGTLKESFVNNDRFSVFARRNNVAASPIFNGETVVYDGTKWTYSPLKIWQWGSTEDYYDFVAVFPHTAPASVRDVSGNINILIPYDQEVDNYDLMASAVRRRGTELNNTSPVALDFKHLLSAVQVVVKNDSETKVFTLDEYHFVNMVVTASESVTLTSGGVADYEWINMDRTTDPVCGETFSPGREITPGEENKYVGGFDFMFPQALDTEWGAGLKPSLIITYTPAGGVQTTVTIPLDEILQADGQTPILSWTRGVKYTYNVSFRIDGGVLVNIITTEWDVAEAEIPGLLI